MKKLVLLIICLAGHFVAYSQGEEIVKTYISEKSDKAAYVPFGASSISNPVSNLLFSSSKGESLASVRVGYSFSSKFSSHVEVSSPLSKSGVTKPVGLDGLPNDGKFTLGFQYKGWKALTSGQIQSALAGYKKQDGSPANSFMDLTEEDKYKVLKNDLHLSSPWFFGGTFTLSKAEYTYATDNTLNQIVDDTKESVSISGYAGFYTGLKLNSLLRVVFLSKSFYKANSANDYFLPFNGGPTLIKRNLVIGAPAESSQTEIKFENVTSFNKNSWGINPSITYLATADAVSFDFPIYFIGGKDGAKKDLGINTGVYLNYTTGLDEPFSAGVFIGSSLTDILKVNK